MYLVENCDRVVSKDELVEEIWQGRFVSDAAVSSVLRDLRRALGDDGRGQRFVRTMRGRGVRFVAALDPVVPDPAPNPDPNPAMDSASVRPRRAKPPAQSIRYCHSADGTRLAYGIAGSGPPLMKTSHWMTHLEYDWESPIWSHINTALAEICRLVRYDARGNGLSDWKVDDFSLERQIEDFEAVVDAAGLDRFPILGISQAAAFSVAYAAKHPERVTKLVFYGGYDRGWRRTGDPATLASREAMLSLIEHDWGNAMATPELLSATYMPNAKPEYWRWFGDLQRKTSTGRNAAAMMDAYGDIDVSPLLKDVRAPAIVLHARGDRGVAFERGQSLAAGLPDARFVTLESENHFLLEDDPAWPRAMDAIRDFLSE